MPGIGSTEAAAGVGAATNGNGFPGGTGLTAAVSPIRLRRWAAKPSESRPASGTSKKAGSAR